jgi:aquaporin Z
MSDTRGLLLSKEARKDVDSYVTEFIGTFFLTLTVGCAVLSKAPLAALAIGSALMVMIYAGGHVSGGHFNPAVTLGVLVRGKITPTHACAYWAAQIAGGFLAAPVARFLINPHGVTALSPHGRGTWVALLAEMLFTFALVYVMLNVATSADHPHNGFYGVAIGFTVVVGVVAVGGVSGGAFNPAVALGASTMGIFAWSKIWIWLVADLVGSVLAGAVFRLQNPLDRGETVFTRHTGA